MNLKDVMRQDIDNVFFNLDEFAEIHNVNGLDIPALIDKEKQSDRTARVSDYVQGLYWSDLILRVKKKDLPYEIEKNQILDLDSKRYLVQEVSETSDVYEITLRANDE